MTIKIEGLQKPAVLVTVAEAAEILRCSKSSLHKWRVTGLGPRYIKVGSRVRYRLGDLDAFIAERSRASTSEKGPH